MTQPAETRRPSRCGATHLRRWIVGIGVAVLALAGVGARAAERALSVADFQVTTWTEKDGAPENIWVMAQTDDGWLWFGGPNGLFRFDGVRFEPVRLDVNANARSTAVSSLYALPDGGLIVGNTSGGISILKNGKTTSYDSEETKRAGRIADFVQDSDGTLWATGFSGILRFDGQAWHPVGSDRGLEASQFFGLLVDASGTLWVTSTEQVLSLKRGRQKFEASGIKVQGGGGELLKSPDGRAWVFDRYKLQLLPSQSATMSGEHLRRFRSSAETFFDREGNLWRSDDAGYRHERSVTGIQSIDKSLTTGLQDAEGNIWFASGGAAIHRLRRPAIVKALDRSPGQTVILGDSSGKVWMGMAGSSSPTDDGLWLFDTAIHRIEPETLKSVTALARTPDGTIWLASRQEGLLRLQDDRLQPSTALPEASRGNYIKGISPDCAGGIWVSVAPTLLKLEAASWRENGGVPGLPAEMPNVQACDSTRNLWLGYASGKLFRVAGDNAHMFSASEGLDVGKVTAINIGPRHVVIGGERGLAILQSNRFAAISGADSRLLDRPTAIVETNNGDVWINSSRGLARIGAPEINRWQSSNGTTTVAVERFDASDGYPGPGYAAPESKPTASIASDGRIWFATGLGVAWIDPSQTRRPLGKPPVVIQALAAGDDRFEPAPDVRLAKGTRSVQIDYTALSYSHPERLRFRYRLDGIDEHWVEASGRRQASYSNLGPGDYRFRVDATDESGVWTDSDTSLAFVIPPTFFQSGAFVFLCIAASFGLLGFLYTVRVRQLTLRERLLVESRMQERERIARELHDTLLQGTQALVLKVHAATSFVPADNPARRMLGNVLKSAEEVIVEGRDRIQELRGTTALFTDIAEQLTKVGKVFSGSETQFRLLVSGKYRPLAAGVSDAVYYIGREATLNAFCHARANLVQVEILYGDDLFRLLVRDDGIGIQQTPASSDKARRHWGLAGMRERASAIGAELEISTGSGSGTELQLKIGAAVAYEAFALPSRWRVWFRSPRRAPAP